MHFESLDITHTEQLLAFELENRAYFESVIASRGTDFYSMLGVSQHIKSLLKLKRQSLAYSFVLVNNGFIIARANIKDIHRDGIAEIGYRVGESAAGRGVGSLCVAHLVNTAINLKLKQLCAFVINNNPASEKVLFNNGFQLDLCIPNGFVHQGRPCHGFQYIRALA